jgi:hypothetical protein
MTATASYSHRVSRAVADARDDLTVVADASVWSMGAAETMATLDELSALAAQVAELQARLLTHAEQIQLPSATGATSTANWHGHRTRTVRSQAHRMMRLAEGLDQREATRAAMAEGRLHADQAHVILDSLKQLPDDLDPELVEQAEQHLIGRAADFDANGLRHLGRRLLEVVAPEAADAHLAKLLEREEHEAAKATTLTMWEDGQGKVHGRFTLDALTGAMLKKHLLALAAPKHRASKGPLGERRPTPERLGEAFAELVQRYPATRLPKAGGLNATIVVLMPLQTLLGGLKAAKLDTGETISPGLARKLACEAGIIPAVLGGDSQVLDLGRKRRFHNGYQRIKATIEHRGCAIEGCDYPPGMCHMHHPTAWSNGGGTNSDGILICPQHHTRAHHPAYTMTKVPTGKYGFHRRT